MKPLKAIFDQQVQSAAAGGRAEAQEERAMIRFTIKGSLFVVGIEHVIEVSEMLSMVKYPEAAFGHEGIVNLRGNIMPVLSFRDQQSTGPLRLCENRLIVLEFSPGRRFCAMASSPKKVSLPVTAIRGDQDIVSVDGTPARIIKEKDFPASFGEEGAT